MSLCALFQRVFRVHRRRKIWLSTPRSLQTSAMRPQQSCVVEVGKIAYWMRDRVELLFGDTFVRDGDAKGIVPAIVLNTNLSSITVDFLESKLRAFEAEDDVFSVQFSHGGIIYIQCFQETQNATNVAPAAQEYLDKRESKLLLGSKETTKLPEGPYLVDGSGVHQAWRLYPDILEAFVTAVVPSQNHDEPYSFQPLPASAYDGLHSVLAVPSRLYTPPSTEKPLNGVRVTVKDIFHVRGIVTTLGSRAYADCYGPQEYTSDYLKHLIDLGVVLVGKTKMSAFAGSEIPPEKCIDYFPPWNPRADGYQGPSGSSSGAGSTIAGYDWLDVSLASDTTGSMRMPASAYGLWALRMGVNAVSWEGIVPSVPLWDTIGVLGRHPNVVKKFFAESTTSAKNLKVPTKLLYPVDWFPRPDHNQQRMNELFVQALEASMGVQRTEVSLSGLWSDSAPRELRNIPLAEYLALSAYWVNNYDGYHTFDQFRKDYNKKFGKNVYVSPWHRARWNRGIGVDPKERKQGLGEIGVFKSWIEEHVMPSATNDSSTIMVMPLGRPGANYRDELPKPTPPDAKPDPLEDTAYEPIFFSTIMGFPQLVVPIGQNGFQSRNSGNEEFVPIVGSLVGSTGTELQLLQTAQDALEKAGWPISVLTGPLAFRLADNERNAGLHDSLQLANESQQQRPFGFDVKHSL